MKAWIVREKDEFSATVVFAETRGKARSIATYTECCEDVYFCDIEVRRAPQVDKYYKDGVVELDWDTPEHRIILCKECDFYCDPDYRDDCDKCCAKDYCDYYLDNYEEDKKEWENE